MIEIRRSKWKMREEEKEKEEEEEELVQYQNSYEQTDTRVD